MPTGHLVVVVFYKLQKKKERKKKFVFCMCVFSVLKVCFIVLYLYFLTKRKHKDDLHTRKITVMFSDIKHNEK